MIYIIFLLALCWVLSLVEGNEALSILLFCALVTCIGCKFMTRNGKEITQWKVVGVMFISVVLLLPYISFLEEYSSNRREKEWHEKMSILRQQEGETRAEKYPYIRFSDGGNTPASSMSSNQRSSGTSSYSSDYGDNYDDGYEGGYEDGMHRDHGARKRSEDFDYEDGYSQGYYDAVHEDEDWEDDEEEDW